MGSLRNRNFPRITMAKRCYCNLPSNSTFVFSSNEFQADKYCATLESHSLWDKIMWSLVKAVFSFIWLFFNVDINVCPTHNRHTILTCIFLYGVVILSFMSTGKWYHFTIDLSDNKWNCLTRRSATYIHPKHNEKYLYQVQTAYLCSF